MFETTSGIHGENADAVLAEQVDLATIQDDDEALRKQLLKFNKGQLFHCSKL